MIAAGLPAFRIFEGWNLAVAEMKGTLHMQP